LIAIVIFSGDTDGGRPFCNFPASGIFVVDLAVSYRYESLLYIPSLYSWSYHVSGSPLVIVVVDGAPEGSTSIIHAEECCSLALKRRVGFTISLSIDVQGG